MVDYLGKWWLMSEKRFFCRRKIIIDGTNILKTEEIVDLLNSLSEENEELRQRNRKLYKCALYGKTIGDEI